MGIKNTNSGNTESVVVSSYEDAGVDLKKARDLISMIKRRASTTFDDRVVSGIGGFAGLFDIGDRFLVCGADGVGTKLKLAFEMERHVGIGMDLVAMSVNDILTCGARPLFFMDYFASGSLNLNVLDDVVLGIVKGCKQSGMALLGGETAEMPGMYGAGEYDVAGFAVGEVFKHDLVDGAELEPGDVVLGFPSSGFHSNGYSLLRKALQNQGFGWLDKIPRTNRSLGDILLEPTRIYVADVMNLRRRVPVKSMAHITGGGLRENAERSFPDGLCFVSNDRNVPFLFSWVQEQTGISDEEMENVFNMGVGMVFSVAPEHVAMALADSDAFIVGYVEKV